MILFIVFRFYSVVLDSSACAILGRAFDLVFDSSACAILGRALDLDFDGPGRDAIPCLSSGAM